MSNWKGKVVVSDKLLTVGAFADMLNVPKSFVYQLNHHGTGPSIIRLGARTVRYHLSDVLEFIAERTEPPRREETLKYFDPFK